MTPNIFVASFLKSPMFDKSIPVPSSSQSELPKDPSGSIGILLEQLEKEKTPLGKEDEQDLLQAFHKR
ncbi:hypothetical protein SESBI_43464, partial [Sesbania bispinosa]